MAYKTKLEEHKCDKCQTKKATYAVKNRFNAIVGYYCTICADRVVNELIKKGA